MDRYDHRKVVTPAMEAYIRRIWNEGYYITGRPQMRRKVTRELVTVDGEPMIKRTIFELDGTTTVSYKSLFPFNFLSSRQRPRADEGFMVPFLVNRIANGFKSVAECWRDVANSLVDELYGHDMERGASAPLSNRWPQPPARPQYA